MELKRSDRISKIKSRQKRFFENCKKLKKEEAVMRCILDLCQELEIVQYYEALQDGIEIQQLQKMKLEIESSTGTQCIRYKEIYDMSSIDPIYYQFLREDKRILITKWRLSSHNLNIEKGRYTSPITPREERICKICTTCIENEHHVLFDCPLYNIVRIRFRDFFQMNNTVKKMLNPLDIQKARTLGEILIQIEEIRKSEVL